MITPACAGIRHTLSSASAAVCPLLGRGMEVLLWKRMPLVFMAVVNYGIGFVFLVTLTEALVKETDVQKDLEAARRKQPFEYEV